MRREERINDWIEWVAEGRSNSNSTHTSFRTTKAKLKLVEWIASGVNGVNLIQWNTPIQSYLIEWCDFMNFINNIITVREGNER